MPGQLRYGHASKPRSPVGAAWLPVHRMRRDGVRARAGGRRPGMHLASAASPADYLKHPVQTLNAGGLGTLRCLGLAGEKNARFVLASTSEVYGDPLEHPQRESYWGN